MQLLVMASHCSGLTWAAVVSLADYDQVMVSWALQEHQTLFLLIKRSTIL